MTELAIRPQELVIPDQPVVQGTSQFAGIGFTGPYEHSDVLVRRVSEGLATSTAPVGSHDLALEAAFIREALEAEPDRTIFSLKARPNGDELARQLFSHDEPAQGLALDTSKETTGLLVTVAPGTDVILPPAAPDAAEQHDLDAEARLVEEHQDEIDSRSLPPLLSSWDALTTQASLFNGSIVDRLRAEHGPDVYDQTVLKVKAIAAVAIGEVYQTAKGAVRQYNLLRLGAEPDDTLPILNPQKVAEDLDPYVDKPFYNVPSEPLIFSPKESDVVLAALRWTALDPKGLSHNHAAMDVLSRYAPTEKERNLNRAMLESAGLQLDTAQDERNRPPTYYHGDPA